MLIYKIFRIREWDELRETGTTKGAPIDLADGYIHFSTGAQVVETCRRHFASEDDLILAVLDTEDFGAYLKWDVSRGGVKFPHLYRSLRLEDVMWHTELPLGSDGHIFPEGVE